MTPPTTQLAVRIGAELKERLTATVAGLKDTRDPQPTLRTACEEALTAWIQTQENQHNHGQPFPHADLEPGRPRTRRDRST